MRNLFEDLKRRFRAAENGVDGAEILRAAYAAQPGTAIHLFNIGAGPFIPPREPMRDPRFD